MSKEEKSELRTLSELYHTLDVSSDNTDKMKVMRTVLEAVRNLGFGRARIYRYDPSEAALVGMASTGSGILEKEFAGLRLSSSGDKNFTKALKLGHASIAQPKADEDSLRLLLSHRVREWIDVPLFADGQVMGKLTIDNGISGRKFVERDLELASVIGGILAQKLKGITPQSFSEHLAHLKKTTVLILGKDAGVELQILRGIADTVRRMGFQPQLVKDEPDIPEMTNEEKVRAYASAARFVLLENTFPAGQIVEVKIMSTNRIVTALLRQKGHGSTWMVSDYDIDFKFMREFAYEPRGLSESVMAACKWADHLVDKRREKLNARYPWRNQKKRRPQK